MCCTHPKGISMIKLACALLASVALVGCGDSGNSAAVPTNVMADSPAATPVAGVDGRSGSAGVAAKAAAARYAVAQVGNLASGSPILTASGMVVGSQFEYDPAAQPPVTRHAVVWTEAAGLRRMEGIGPGAEPVAVNVAGQVIFQGSPLIWSEAGIREITAPPGFGEIGPIGINDAGQVLVQNTAGGSAATQLVLWDPVNGPRLIPTQHLDGPGLVSGLLTADGRVLGAYLNSESRWKPFVWSESGGTVADLLPPGAYSASFHSVAPDGRFIGSLNDGGYNEPFFWSEAQGIQRIDIASVGTRDVVVTFVNARGELAGLAGDGPARTAFF